MRNWLLGGFTVLFLALCWCLRAAPVSAAQGLTFEIRQPQANQTLTGSVIPLEINFQSTADAPVVRFDAYLDSTWILGGTITNPMSSGFFKVDAKLEGLAIKPGSHSLYVKLYTNQGTVAQREQRIALALQSESVAPTVRILNPKPGDTIDKRTNIKVEANDRSGIKLVMLYINGNLRALMNQPPFEMPWDPITEKFQPGVYSLTARALDLFDNEGVSDPITVTVPSMRTPIEVAVPVKIDTPPIGVLNTADGPGMPSLGEGWERAPLAGLAPTLGDWTQGIGLLLPAPIQPEPRTYVAFNPSGDPLALLPTKSLPNRDELMTLPTLVALGQTSALELPTGSATIAGGPVKTANASPAHVVDPRGIAVPPALGTLAPAGRDTALAQGTPTTGSTPVLIAKVSPSSVDQSDLFPHTPAPALVTGQAQPAELPSVNTTQVHPTPVAKITPGTLPEAVSLPTPSAVSAKPAIASEQPKPQASPVLIAKATPVQNVDSPLPATPSMAVTPKAVPVPVAKPTMTIRAPYVVQRGDTIQKIAKAFSTTPDELKKLNPGLTPTPVANTHLVVPRTDLKVYLDSKPLACTPEPYVAQGYTMVPFRKLVETKDGTVVWVAETKEVKAWANGTYMNLGIGKREAKLDAQTVLLPVPATIQSGRTMAPLRYVATALDLQIQYNAATGTYYLVSRTTP